MVRLACYACKVYGCIQDEKPWQVAGSRLSNARMMLRLFDDIPMIRHTYNYGLGRHVCKPDFVSTLLTFQTNLLENIFILDYQLSLNLNLEYLVMRYSLQPALIVDNHIHQFSWTLGSNTKAADATGMNAKIKKLVVIRLANRSEN